MMNYNPMGQMPYYQNNMFTPHPSYFANAMNQNYGNVSQPQVQSQQQSQPQQTQNQQTITTQPPIMQSSKIISVSNKEEATGASVDLIYGTPSFFYNVEKLSQKVRFPIYYHF